MEQAHFDTLERGVRHKMGKGAGSRQMIILEQEAPKMTKRSMGQEKKIWSKRKN